MIGNNNIIITILLYIFLIVGFHNSNVIYGLPVDPPIEPNVTTIDYTHDLVELQAYYAIPSDGDNDGPFPAVVIIPDWDGVNFYEQARATMFAQQSKYVAVAADIYGKELHTVDSFDQRMELSQFYKSNITLFTQRIQKAINITKEMSMVDPNKIALVGYCFGGSGVLMYALQGYNDVQAIISIHGGLDDVLIQQHAMSITPKILVLSGGQDDMSSAIMDLELTFDNATKINETTTSTSWEITRFDGIGHAWTVWENAGYDEWADMRTWDSANHFLQEVFGEIEFVSNEPASFNVQDIPYEDIDGTQLQGYLALPSSSTGTSNSTPPYAAVIILPDWTGVDVYEKKRATLLADAGYAAFAADIYGAEYQDVTNETLRTELYQKYTSNMTLFLQRINRAFDLIKTEYADTIDIGSLAIIGYCFGGTGVVNYAFSGATDAKVAVAYHGGLSTLPNVTTNISMYVMIESGGDDPVHGNQTILEEALNNANAEWEISRYGGVVHGFTVWTAGDAYNVVADSRSWEAMMQVFSKKLKSEMKDGVGTETKPPAEKVDSQTTEPPKSTGRRMSSYVGVNGATAIICFLFFYFTFSH